MADQSVFSFLGEDLLNSQLSDFTTIIRNHFPQNVQADQVLSDKLDRFASRQDTWPKEIIKVYKNRSPPIYSVEDIVSINNAHTVDIEQINTIRKSRIDAFSVQLKTLYNIDRTKKQKNWQTIYFD
jgi:hypothetical protein